MAKKNILAISGSTRAASSNLNLIRAITALTIDLFSIEIFDGLMSIPPFNPDDDGAQPPLPVRIFRDKIKSADGIVICTPEYAMGVPGVLKNAIDWTVSSCDFSGKPTALITASSSGEKGHSSLTETLLVIEAQMPEETRLLISFVKTKVSNEGRITDEKTLTDIKRLIAAFEAMLHSPEKNLVNIEQVNG